MRAIVPGLALLTITGCASQQAEVKPAPTAHSQKTYKQVVTLAEARQLGFQIVDQDGKTVYCRDDMATGSHIRKETICLTAEQLKAVRDASERNIDQLQHVIPPPGCGRNAKLGC